MAADTIKVSGGWERCCHTFDLSLALKMSRGIFCSSTKWPNHERKRKRIQVVSATADIILQCNLLNFNLLTSPLQPAKVDSGAASQKRGKMGLK